MAQGVKQPWQALNVASPWVAGSERGQPPPMPQLWDHFLSGAQWYRADFGVFTDFRYLRGPPAPRRELQEAMMFDRNHRPVLASLGRSSFKCRLQAGQQAEGRLDLGQPLP